ncbi:class II aldolase/adducin family protein [Bradyrhizobium sp. BRP22]|uniref:class II aldolase and adducin N-terminal domain-containing protein n=1 Tax=Bradyrhizobium sp. BRP22 TaxID=2793821 RepID=UPI001CD7099D|nr:class II aldolase and adducin N-terminal domain-containing protein [Bradyrhizobium sp. BRP22]MCA1453010.1 class II aldolase/adducin family protein [Bradyrhizobium sp. BRP22]
METNTTVSDERQLRIDLAAAFRLFAKLGMHEAVANHFSAAVSTDGRKFLMNPKWRHFSRIKASDLVLFDLDAEDSRGRQQDVDPTAWSIHSQMHRLLPQARVVLHLHPPFVTTIASLANPEIKPIDQNTARYFNRVALDSSYSGMADSEQEGARLARLLGNRSRLMMGNHGVMIAARTVGEAFDDMYTIERACQTLVQAYSTGQPLKVLPDDVAERTAQDWEGIADFSEAHFAEMKELLNVEDPSYAH